MHGTYPSSMHCEEWSLWFTVVCGIHTNDRLKLPKYTQVLSLDALNLVVYIQIPVGPYYQAIDTFLRLHDHPMQSGPEHYLSIVFLLLCFSAGDLEGSKTTEHSSAIGD